MTSLIHRARMERASVLIISGSMGAGKTTVMGEASDLLLMAGRKHATIDVDAIGLHLLAEPESRQLHYRNLSTIYSNCISVGLANFLVAAAVENHDALNELRAIFSNAEVKVCRLTAARATLQARLRVREPGLRQNEFIERSATLDTVLGRVALEDFTVVNEGRNITEVARELLERATWVEPF